MLSLGIYRGRDGDRGHGADIDKLGNVVFFETTAHRKDSVLEKQLARLTAQADKKAAKGIRASEAEVEAARIGPRSIAATRKKLKLGQTEFGLLVGVSKNAIYMWESGESRPSRKWRAALVGLRKLGVREARKMLEGME